MDKKKEIRDEEMEKAEGGRLIGAPYICKKCGAMFTEYSEYMSHQAGHSTSQDNNPE